MLFVVQIQEKQSRGAEEIAQRQLASGTVEAHVFRESSGKTKTAASSNHSDSLSLASEATTVSGHMPYESSKRTEKTGVSSNNFDSLSSASGAETVGYDYAYVAIVSGHFADDDVSKEAAQSIQVSRSSSTASMVSISEMRERLASLTVVEDALSRRQEAAMQAEMWREEATQQREDLLAFMREDTSPLGCVVLADRAGMSMYDEAPSAAKRYWRDSAQRAKEIENVFRFSKIFELESELLAVVRELADHGHIELIGALPKKISPTVEKWGCFIK
mmetsp:Transcript_39337/g.92747  ORF Transcript_39337/g.92747 Transcript_39337/m.92747 type:complete len:275 (-) Transcript_39337:206-1030(-)